MNYPYGVYRDDGVYVIWHYYDGIQFDVRISIWQIQPFTADDIAVFVQTHFAIDQIAEDAFAAMCAYRYKIGAGT
jgi:hypothetical protein